ncbi:MAG: phosphatase PAP2 family protein [Cytophagales bacterium]|nr:phosphatase PAP2 family protein [Cytophagales bacterium]
MAYVTSTNFWIPLYVLLLLFLIWKYKYDLRFTIYVPLLPWDEDRPLKLWQSGIPKQKEPGSNLGFLIKESWLIILAIILLITASDLFSSSLIKPLVQRLRPCHNLVLHDLVHVVVGCGGQYGFFSSHASNTFSLAVFLWLITRNTWRMELGAWSYALCAMRYALLLWATLVSYSRIYVGVHYPGDIITGALVGSLFAYLFFKVYLKISRLL